MTTASLTDPAARKPLRLWPGIAAAVLAWFAILVLPRIAPALGFYGVIGGAVGGIPEQITHNVTGKLVHSIDGCAYQLRQLLSDPEQAARLGRYGREWVRQEFLITSNLQRWLTLFNLLGHEDDVVPLREVTANGATTAGLEPLAGHDPNR